MARIEASLPPLSERPGLLRWLYRNLFRTWYDALLTVLSLGLIGWAGWGLLVWVFTAADWSVISANLRLFMVGQYPARHDARLWTAVGFVMFLSGNSLAIWARRSYVAGVLLLGLPLLLAFLPLEAQVRLWLAVQSLIGFAGWIAGRVAPEPLKRPVLFGWCISLPVFILLTRGLSNSEGWFEIVGTNLWGGLLLTMLLTVVGIIFSFPLGVLLALGRRSELPVIRWASVGYIEVIRGVPLITILFMAQLMLPLFLPANLTVDRILRAMVGITLFSAAYLAENVRGGLQAISRGQYEAAHALGLNGAQTMIFVILPQALRLIIPILVGQFIAVFKDTSLVAIVGLFDLLGIAKTVLAQPDFLGLQREVYAFISLLYWVLSYGMSYVSQRLEQRLGVGSR